MLKVLLDTNILLDAIAARDPFKENAEKIIMLIAEDKVQGFLTANSLIDIYYIARKTIADSSVRLALRNIFKIFSIIDVCGVDAEKALEYPMKDFEDAVLVICAEKTNIDYIITRDDDFLKTVTAISVISPDDFLKIKLN